VEALERVQKRFTRMLPGMEGISGMLTGMEGISWMLTGMEYISYGEKLKKPTSFSRE